MTRDIAEVLKHVCNSLHATHALHATQWLHRHFQLRQRDVNSEWLRLVTNRVLLSFYTGCKVDQIWLNSLILTCYHNSLKGMEDQIQCKAKFKCFSIFFLFFLFWTVI